MRSFFRGPRSTAVTVKTSSWKIQQQEIMSCYRLNTFKDSQVELKWGWCDYMVQILDHYHSQCFWYLTKIWSCLAHYHVSLPCLPWQTPSLKGRLCDTVESSRTTKQISSLHFQDCRNSFTPSVSYPFVCGWAHHRMTKGHCCFWSVGRYKPNCLWMRVLCSDRARCNVEINNSKVGLSNE